MMIYGERSNGHKKEEASYFKHFDKNLSHKIFRWTKFFVRQNYSPDKIFLTKPKFCQFRLTNICPIRYFMGGVGVDKLIYPYEKWCKRSTEISNFSLCPMDHKKVVSGSLQLISSQWYHTVNIRIPKLNCLVPISDVTSEFWD